MSDVESYTFIYTRAFTLQWEDAGLNDADLRRLENLLMRDPEAGAVIADTGGLRKLRIAISGRGTPQEKKAIKKYLSQVENYVRGK